MTYDEARAFLEKRAAELEAHGVRYPATLDRSFVETATAIRTLLAGPPEPSEEEVARVLSKTFGESKGLQARAVQALYRSRRA